MKRTKHHLLFLSTILISFISFAKKKAKGDYQYKALLGDRKPALNYRD